MLACFSLFYCFCERWYYIGHFSLQFPLYLSLSASNYLEHRYVPPCSPLNYSLMIQLNILEKIMDKKIHKIFSDSRKVRIKKTGLLGEWDWFYLSQVLEELGVGLILCSVLPTNYIANEKKSISVMNKNVVCCVCGKNIRLTKINSS